MKTTDNNIRRSTPEQVNCTISQDLFDIIKSFQSEDGPEAIMYINITIDAMIRAYVDQSEENPNMSRSMADIFYVKKVLFCLAGINIDKR